MTYPVPASVDLADGRTAVLDHATDYTEEPLPGEERPGHQRLFAYYRLDGALRRVLLNLKVVKFAPDQLGPIVAASLAR